MSIEIISLTSKGDALANSVRQGHSPEWAVVNYLRRMGGRATRDRLIQFVFNNNVGVANAAIRNLKYKGIITGE
jgi:hypothetical protein